MFTKYYCLADRRQKQFSREEAAQMAGFNPEYSREDLWQAIERGEFVLYIAHVQIIQRDEADSAQFGFDLFDVMKV